MIIKNYVNHEMSFRLSLFQSRELITSTRQHKINLTNLSVMLFKLGNAFNFF